MGNIDSIPVVSQVKSLTEYISGDSAGALATQKNFAYNNTFLEILQIVSGGYGIGGDSEKALDLKKKFADDMEKVIDSIPVAGHIKGPIHFAVGDAKKGFEVRNWFPGIRYIGIEGLSELGAVKAFDVGKDKISEDEGCDVLLPPVSDGSGGYDAGRGIEKALGLDRFDAEAGQFFVIRGGKRINA